MDAEEKERREKTDRAFSSRVRKHLDFFPGDSNLPSALQ